MSDNDALALVGTGVFAVLLLLSGLYWWFIGCLVLFVILCMCAKA